MSKKKCAYCGKDPAEGFATIDGVRFCHGDWEPDPTCYMQGQRIYSGNYSLDDIWPWEVTLMDGLEDE